MAHGQRSRLVYSAFLRQGIAEYTMNASALAACMALTFVTCRAAESSATQAMRLAREAAIAADAQDTATYLAKMEAAVALRPDFPRMLVNLAAAQVAAERPDDALATLDRLASLGLSSPVEKSEDFAALRPRKEFQAVVKKLAGNLHPKGAGEVAFSLRDVTGLIEGIAWREKTDEFYFGDVNGRAVWARNKEGTLRRLTPEGDGLLGVFGLAIDEATGTIWAATAAVPAMSGFTPDQDGTAALAEIDLETGAVRRTVPVVRRPGDQQSHVLGDLALAADGSVFATDSGGPTLWRLGPGGAALEPYVENVEFLSLQGIVLLPEGVAVLSDHANGLLRVELATRNVRRLESPPDTSLIGLDGLALTPEGQVLAIQNGLRPNRVLRVDLEGAAESVLAVSILESGHITMAAPSLGCLGTGGDFFYVGNAGWTRFEGTDGQPSTPRVVPIFRTKLPKKKK
jgi:sugar lactone lactonase YvrE